MNLPVPTLPTRQLNIASDNWQQLHMNPWSQSFVPVEFWSNGEWIHAELRLRGGHTREYSKKSYELRLTNGDSLHWNAEYDDPSLMRNALSLLFFASIGVPSPQVRHCLLVANGRPLGTYLELEAVNEHYLRRRSLQARAIIYAVNDNANFKLHAPETKQRKPSLFAGYELAYGSTDSKLRLSSFIRQLNRLQGRKLRQLLESRVDIGNYLNWLAGAVLTGNYDGFEQNYSLLEGMDGRYRIMPWDYEGTWGRNCYGQPCAVDSVRVQGYNKLTRLILNEPLWKKDYCHRTHDLLETRFTADRLKPTIDALHQSLYDAVQNDPKRKWPFAVFSKEPEYILHYIEERRAVVKQALRRWLRPSRTRAISAARRKGGLYS